MRRFACFVWFLLGAAVSAAAPFTFGPAGALEKLEVGGDVLVFKANEATGFSAFDVTAQRPVSFSSGQVRTEGGKTRFEAVNPEGVSLRAEFTPKDGYLLVTGELESRTARALVLDYRLGTIGADARLFRSLNEGESQGLAEMSAEIENSLVPIGAVAVGGKTAAIAIPPDHPMIFGIVGSRAGLAVRLYLGVTPLTEKFPNRAPFAFIIYPSTAGWGFRGALDRYYSFYPASYRPRTDRAGLWLFQVKGKAPETPRQYAYNVLEIHSKDLAHDLARDRANGIMPLLYTLQGQRELKFLDKLPGNYAAAMEAFEKWTPDRIKAYPFVTKESVVAGTDRWLKDEIENSGVKEANGEYSIVLRDTPWGKKSVSFRMNPSPHLFANENRRTVGRDGIELVDGWLREHPDIGGVLLDSFGANWPAVLNYREDHFKYAQHPLTFDAKGRLAIYNDLSHYEYAAALKTKLDREGKLLFANGIYSYQARPGEHYKAAPRQRVKIGRFFDASLFDGACCERGSKNDTEQVQEIRVFMGQKYYALINYRWGPGRDPDRVEEFFNRSLCYAIFPSNTKYYPESADYVEYGNEGLDYVNNPEGEQLFKKLTDWVVPNVSRLHRAGWQPITHARTKNADVYIERYGSGQDVYLAVFNDSVKKRRGTVEVDLAALGFKDVKIKEVARGVAFENSSPGMIAFEMEPLKTYVFHLTSP